MGAVLKPSPLLAAQFRVTPSLSCKVKPPRQIESECFVLCGQVDALWTLAFAGQPQEPLRWRTRERWEAVLRHSYAVSIACSTQ